MVYIWLASTDKYERISAWRDVPLVYNLVDEGLFSSTKTRVSARLVPARQNKPTDLEMMLGTWMIKLNAFQGTPADYQRRVEANKQVLAKQTVSLTDIFYASAARVPSSYRLDFEIAVRTLCRKWLGRT